MTPLILTQKLWQVIRYMTFFLIFLTGYCLAETPLSIQAGTPQWKGLHVTVPLTLTLRKGWKLYGPPSEGDTLKFQPHFVITDKSNDNIQEVRATWPATTPCRDYGQKGSVFYESVTVMVDLTLKENRTTAVNLPLKCLMCAHTCMPLTQVASFLLTPPPVETASYVPFLKMLGLGFLGGLILNIMPCVLPVLGIKLKGLAAVSRETFKALCWHTSAGIMVSFWLLACLILAMKYIFQYEVGWGIQFQNPYFSSVMCLLMVIFALSFLGIFHFKTPSWIEKALPSSGKKTTAAFFSGVFAVFLATPCSAPMLGAALGFALTGTSIDVLSIFTCIGLGFAFPYGLGLLWPSIGRYVPKPGPWSLYLERGMGILFLSTAAWLLSTSLNSFLTPKAQLLAWILLGLLVLFPLTLKTDICHRLKSMRYGIYGISLFLGGTFLGLPFFFPENTGEHSVTMVDGSIHWLPWSRRSMEEAVRNGKIIFIDMTASWCGNCWVNKQRVFMNPTIQKLLRNPDIVCFRGDFSKGSEEILHFLKEHKRAGIPFNMVLSKKYPQGIVLSEWLTSEEVIKVITWIRKAPFGKQ